MDTLDRVAKPALQVDIRTIIAWAVVEVARMANTKRRTGNHHVMLVEIVLQESIEVNAVDLMADHA